MRVDHKGILSAGPSTEALSKVFGCKRSGFVELICTGLAASCVGMLTGIGRVLRSPHLQTVLLCNLAAAGVETS